ncbi:CoA transferase [Mycobacterium sp.]|uniref:CoA transferase n=1 Tax=Mycobacterium sp. TaxID=1785 RepID=UPI003F9D0B5D
MNAAEKLAKAIIENYDNPLQGSTIDVPAHVESLLQSLGATTSDSGGKVTYYGSDPITPDRLPYGSISAISLAAKAILIAKIWKERTGEGQDIHIDVRKALRRLTPFLEGKWELVNGFPGRTDPFSPFSGGPDIVPTRDGKWIMLAEPYPALRQRALDLLKPKGGFYEALRDAVKEWNGEELEEAGEKAGVPMPLARNIKDVLKMDAFTKNLGLMPLVSVEKVGESDPIPFTPNPTTPLDGIRLLSSSHVIAAPSIGRAMALHGADSLNVWRPSDVEHTLWHYTSHVGVRSTMLELADKEGHAKFSELLSQADVLVTNRRTGWRDRFHITSEDVIKERPGLIDTQITWAGETGQWSNRVGFDITATFALGLDNIEGSDEKPAHPSIFVACDYAAGWLATCGILSALLRRAKEGGSYRVRVSLVRTALWLAELGIFDRDYVKKTAGSNDEHLYPDPDGFVVDTPMGRYTGIKEMVEMSKTPGEYKYPLTPFGSWQPSWL